MDDKELEEIKKNKISELSKEKFDPKIKAEEFAKAILECEEYKNFIRHNEELQKDERAQRLLNEFQQKQMEMQWSDFDPKILEELKELQIEINNNQTIQKFVNSQNELIDIIRRANNIISSKIGIQFAFSQGGCCSG